MSQYRTSSIVDASTLIEYATIAGKLIPASSEDHMKLARIAWEFRKAVQVASRMIARGVEANAVLKELRRPLNKAYADSAFKLAKAIVGGCVATGGDPRKVEIRKLFIVSGGESSRLGNRNIRLEDTSVVKNQVPLRWVVDTAESNVWRGVPSTTEGARRAGKAEEGEL